MHLPCRKFLTLVLFVLLLSPFGFSSYGYEETAVSDGGTLRGKVRLLGDVPKPKAYNLVTFPDPVYCGRISNGHGWRLLQPFHVGPEGQFGDVVVMIENVAKGKPIASPKPRIEASDCTFKPFISVVSSKQPLEIINMDPIFHDIQAYETSKIGPRVLFNSPLPMNSRYTKEGVSKSGRAQHLPGTPMEHRVVMHKGRRAFLMQCGFHSYMESWGLVVDNPYYALTDEDGGFIITDIPPGTYKVTVWHPVVHGESGLEYEVTIDPNESTNLNVDIPAPKGRLYANQMEDNPRFGLGIMGDTEILPTVEKQEY